MNTDVRPPTPDAFMADYHVHVTAWRGKDPAMTVAGALHHARELGLVEIGLLEHLAPSRGRPVTSLEGIRKDLETVKVPEGLRVFRGVETDVTPEGTFDGPPNVREALELDYVIAAVHGASPGTPDTDLLEDHLRQMLAVLAGETPFEIMAHPWRGAYKRVAAALGRPSSFDVVPLAMQQKLIKACVARGVAVEVNAGSPLDDPAHDAFLTRALAAGLKLATGSDAHYLRSIETHRICVDALKRIGAGPSDVWRPDTSHTTHQQGKS